MYRKIVALLIAVLLTFLGPIIQATCLIVFLIICVQVNSALRPYETRQLNDTEDLALLAEFVTIYCGIFFQQNKVDKNATDAEKEIVEVNKMVLTFLIVAANILFLVQWLINFMGAIRGFIKQQSIGVYVAVFLCCRQDNLEKDLIQIAQDKKRENIIEKIEEVQFYFRNLKTMYEKRVFYEGHERFIQLLYYIEEARARIDLREKDNNLYIEGDIARDRNYDKKEMEKQRNIQTLGIDVEAGGENLGMLKILEISNKKVPGLSKILSSPTRTRKADDTPIKLDYDDIGARDRDLTKASDQDKMAAAPKKTKQRHHLDESIAEKDQMDSVDVPLFSKNRPQTGSHLKKMSNVEMIAFEDFRPN